MYDMICTIQQSSFYLRISATDAYGKVAMYAGLRTLVIIIITN